MKKSALISAVAMLVVAVVALTTASFAWFSASSNANVDNFDVTVKGGSSLLINTVYTETDSSKYSGSVGLSVPKDVTYGAVTPVLQSTDGTDMAVKVENSELKFQRITNLDAAAAAGSSVAASYTDAFANTWFTADLFVKAASIPQGQSLDVSLDLRNDLTKFTDNIVAVADKVANGDAVKALRVAFVIDEMQSESAAAAGATKVVVYEPDNGDATANSEYSDANRLCKAIATSTTKVELFNIENEKQNTVFRVRLYLWIEGNDTACAQDIIMEGATATKISAKMSFVGDAKETI